MLISCEVLIICSKGKNGNNKCFKLSKKGYFADIEDLTRVIIS